MKQISLRASCERAIEVAVDEALGEVARQVPAAELSQPLREARNAGIARGLRLLNARTA